MKFPSYVRKFRWERLQSHMWGRASFYMRKMRKYLTKYGEAVSHLGLCNRSILNVLIYEDNLIFFSFSVPPCKEVPLPFAKFVKLKFVLFIQMFCHTCRRTFFLIPKTFWNLLFAKCREWEGMSYIFTRQFTQHLNIFIALNRRTPGRGDICGLLEEVLRGCGQVWRECHAPHELRTLETMHLEAFRHGARISKEDSHFLG